MDIKSKNNNPAFNKFITSIIIILITALAALGVCKSYGIVKKASTGHEYNYFQTNDFITQVIEYSYGINYELLTKNRESKSIEPAAIILDKDKTNKYGVTYHNDGLGTIEELYPDFNQLIYNWNESAGSIYGNLKYFALNKENNQTKTNINEDVNLVKDNNLNLSSINKDDYRFIMQVDFRENGSVEISNLKGADNKTMKYNLSDYVEQVFSDYDYYLNSIKNTSIIFMVPVKMSQYDKIAYGVEDASTYMYSRYGALTGAITVLIVLLAALIMPYKRVKDFNILKIPFEIWTVIIGFDIAAFIGTCEFIVRESIIRDSVKIGELIVKKDMIMLGNFLVWLAILFVAFFGMTVIKSIFKEGIGKYFRTRSIIGKIIVWIAKNVKKTVHYVTEIDLRENNNKYILKLVLINAVILLIITSIWVAGIPLVLIYSIVLFFVIRKYVDDISGKYKKLTEATNEIAEGNLDVNIEEDLGVFNPFKDNLEKIQGGFKKAVNEEVKSQRMKTDLISNVSHDLKTPLTAIITYVDLLKDTNLSEEKRKEYLAIVDRKSQRLQNLIEDLFEMSKASSGNISLNIEKIDIVALMKQTLFELDDKISASSLKVKENFSADKIILALDSQRTFRVFENLIINATKYAMKNTRIYIDIFEEDKEVEIVIKNIAAEEIEFNENEIMERFVRGDKARNTEGSGLGLAIAKSFVELQGGKFNIEIDGDLFKAKIVFKK